MEELQVARKLFEQLLEKNKPADVCAATVLETIKGLVFDQDNSMREKSRTAALWLQYMEMIDVLRTFIKAERTGNWELHLKVLALMLPYLAASGHNLYVKCVRLYLQSMNRLETEHPDVYR